MPSSSPPPRPGRAAAARDRLRRWEPVIRAFVAVDDDAWSRLDTADGPLGGVAVGVKDVVDARGLPTRNGSAAFADVPPAADDAPVVAALRRAGAAIVGKTTSTEFAFVDPTDTRNPHAASHTPGGSSSGSGAAVGAGVLDLAVATQTAGSLCRPAAYCGAVGFKPGHGRLPMQGVSPLSVSFDTVGFIGRDVALVRAAWQAAADGPATSAVDPGAGAAAGPGAGAGAGTAADATAAERPAIGLAVTDPAAPMTDAVLAARAGAAQAASALGFPVADAVARLDFAAIVADHRRVMLHEAARAHAHLLATAANRLRPLFAAALREGLGISAADADAARSRLRDVRERFWDAMSAFDLLLACPVPATAPPCRGGGTGYQHLLTPWTVFGGPLLCLPWGADADGLPLSVMLAGPPGGEARVLAVGAALAPLAPPLPAPSPERAGAA